MFVLHDFCFGKLYCRVWYKKLVWPYNCPGELRRKSWMCAHRRFFWAVGRTSGEINFDLIVQNLIFIWTSIPCPWHVFVIHRTGWVHALVFIALIAHHYCWLVRAHSGAGQTTQLGRTTASMVWQQGVRQSHKNIFVSIFPFSPSKQSLSQPPPVLFCFQVSPSSHFMQSEWMAVRCWAAAGLNHSSRMFFEFCPETSAPCIFQYSAAFSKY